MVLISHIGLYNYFVSQQVFPVLHQTRSISCDWPADDNHKASVFLQTKAQTLPVCCPRFWFPVCYVIMTHTIERPAKNRSKDRRNDKFPDYSVLGRQETALSFRFQTRLLTRKPSDAAWSKHTSQTWIRLSFSRNISEKSIQATFCPSASFRFRSVRFCVIWGNLFTLEQRTQLQEIYDPSCNTQI